MQSQRPNRPGFEFEGFIHWDIDTSLDPLPFDVQGVLAINNNEPGQGGFQCVPGMPKRIREWIATQPEDRDPYRPDLDGLEVVPVPLKAGDLLIWNSLLPHGVSPNRSTRPRIAQYISMSPAQEENEQARQWRIRSWLHRLAPEGEAFPGDPRQWEQGHGDTAALTPLGRKLLGLDSWDPDSEPSADSAAADTAHPERSSGRAIPGFGSWKGGATLLSPFHSPSERFRTLSHWGDKSVAPPFGPACSPQGRGDSPPHPRNNSMTPARCFL